MIAVFTLFSLLMLLMLLVLVPMLGKQLMRLYQLAPLALDWLQHQALPWAQAQFGLEENFGAWISSRLHSALIWAAPPMCSA